MFCSIVVAAGGFNPIHMSTPGFNPVVQQSPQQTPAQSSPSDAANEPAISLQKPPTTQVLPFLILPVGFFPELILTVCVRH